MASRTGGTKRGGNDTAPKSTARSGGTKSAKTRAKSHLARSDAGARSNVSSGTAPTAKTNPDASRTRRGPGSAGTETGRKQRAAGKGQNPPGNRTGEL